MQMPDLNTMSTEELKSIYTEIESILEIRKNSLDEHDYIRSMWDIVREVAGNLELSAYATEDELYRDFRLIVGTLQRNIVVTRSNRVSGKWMYSYPDNETMNVIYTLPNKETIKAIHAEYSSRWSSFSEIQLEYKEGRVDIDEQKFDGEELYESSFDSREILELCGLDADIRLHVFTLYLYLFTPYSIKHFTTVELVPILNFLTNKK